MAGELSLRAGAPLGAGTSAFPSAGSVSPHAPRRNRALRGRALTAVGKKTLLTEAEGGFFQNPITTCFGLKTRTHGLLMMGEWLFLWRISLFLGGWETGGGVWMRAGSKGSQPVVGKEGSKSGSLWLWGSGRECLRGGSLEERVQPLFLL